MQEKRCFTYCGDDKCDCEAAPPFSRRLQAEDPMTHPHPPVEPRADGDEAPRRCPFCGETPGRGVDFEGNVWFECFTPSCPVVTTDSLPEREALAVWNGHNASTPPPAPEPQQPEQVRAVGAEERLKLTADDLLAADGLLYEPDAEDCERFTSRYGRALMDDRFTLFSNTRSLLATIAELRADKAGARDQYDDLGLEYDALITRCGDAEAALATERAKVGELEADKRRMDWLETMTVNVRAGPPHGSRNLFWASQDDSFEGELGPSDIRALLSVPEALFAENAKNSVALTHTRSPAMNRAELIEAMARGAGQAVGISWTDTYASYRASPSYPNVVAELSAQMEAALSAIEGLGLVVVPRVPSVDMIVAATEDWLRIRAMEDRAEVIWDAMIATAPLQPAEPGPEVRGDRAASSIDPNTGRGEA